MTAEQATRRYFTIFIPSMVGYLAGTLGIVWAEDHMALPQIALYGLAIIPIIALFATFWAHWRFMNDVDEFLRMIQMKAILCGLAIVLAIASGWGSLEILADAPRLPVFWLMPIFWVSYSLAAVVITKREGGPLF